MRILKARDAVGLQLHQRNSVEDGVITWSPKMYYQLIMFGNQIDTLYPEAHDMDILICLPPPAIAIDQNTLIKLPEELIEYLKTLSKEYTGHDHLDVFIGKCMRRYHFRYQRSGIWKPTGEVVEMYPEEKLICWGTKEATACV